MTLPKLTQDQRSAACAKACAMRQARKNIKDALKHGRLDLAHALYLPAAQRIRVRDLLRSLPGIGETKADALMAELHVSESRRVQGLGANQKAALLEWWDERNEK